MVTCPKLVDMHYLKGDIFPYSPLVVNSPGRCRIRVRFRVFFPFHYVRHVIGP